MKGNKGEAGVMAKILQIGMSDNPDMSILKDLKDKYSAVPDEMKKGFGKKFDMMEGGEFSSEEVSKLIKALLGVSKEPEDMEVELGEY